MSGIRLLTAAFLPSAQTVARTARWRRTRSQLAAGKTATVSTQRSAVARGSSKVKLMRLPSAGPPAPGPTGPVKLDSVVEPDCCCPPGTWFGPCPVGSCGPTGPTGATAADNYRITALLGDNTSRIVQLVWRLRW